MLAALAVYGVAFVARPLSAFFFGWVGDRFGRRNALSLSILIMGVATACIGLLPGWATVGIVGPAMLLLCRMVQGFSAGGEFSGAMPFIIEHAPKHRRGLWMGLVGASTTIGSMAGSLAVLAAEGIAGDAYAEWGWRLPYLLGGVIAIIGLLLRSSIEESPAYTEAKADAPAEHRSLKELLRFQWRTLIIMFVYFGVVGVLTHTFLGYMPSYMSLVGGVSTQTALVIMTVVSLMSIGTTTATGWSVDRFGRRPIFRAGIIGSVVIIFPAYLLIGTGNPIAIGVGLLAFLIPIELLSAEVTIVLEMLPTRVRYSGMALPYNLAYALFVGTAPVVSQGMIEISGSLLAPAFDGTAFGLVALLVLWRGMPESRGVDLKHGIIRPRDGGDTWFGIDDEPVCATV